MPACHPLHRLLSLLLAVAAVGLLPDFANSRPRNDIRIFGRVVDADGSPLLETRVVVKGSRRSAALVDAEGQYSISIHGTTLVELEREPLALRIQARRRGWYLAMPGGSPELGLEMRLVPDSSGVTRFQVRSNDASIAATLANAAVLETSTRVAIKLDFVGIPGVQSEAPTLDLPEMEEVVFVGAADAVAASAMPDSGMTAQKAPNSASSSNGASGSAPVAGRAVPTSTGSAEPGKTRVRARPATPEEIRQAMEALGEANPTPSRAAIDGSSVDSLEAWASQTTATSGTDRSRSGQVAALAPSESIGAPPNKQVATRDKLAPIPDDPVMPPVNAAAPDKPASLPDSIAAPSVKAAAPADKRTASSASTAVSPPVSPGSSNRSAAPTGGPAVPSDRSAQPLAKAAVPDKPTASSDKPAPSPGSPAPSNDKPAASPDKPAASPGSPVALPDKPAVSSDKPALSSGSPATLNDKPAASPDKPAVSSDKPAVSPGTPTAHDEPPASTPGKPIGMPAPNNPVAAGPTVSPPSTTIPAESARSSPPIVRAVPSVQSGRSCQCHIEGTVEVVSDRPLPERMQVVVYLDDDHKVEDTVELFMGSPRQFDLFGVPCGAHQVRIKVRSKQRFTLTSPDPLVDCSAGGYHQARLVLVPASRWRASR